MGLDGFRGEVVAFVWGGEVEGDEFEFGGGLLRCKREVVLHSMEVLGLLCPLFIIASLVRILLSKGG